MDEMVKIDQMNHHHGDMVIVRATLTALVDKSHSRFSQDKSKENTLARLVHR
jgi:hypothetical protein